MPACLMSSLVFRQEKLTLARAAGCLLGFLGVALSALLLGEGGRAFSARNIAALLLVSGGIFVVNHSAFAGKDGRI